ncbi:hypothetical protein ABT116_43185 [Streptomyces sp. NPDC002130]|uniref:hypothetical protein n=1 Tax=Streptomyces sp. NPDC002130 TaxID=3155568 RepID=UPI0033306346
MTTLAERNEPAVAEKAVGRPRVVVAGSTSYRVLQLVLLNGPPYCACSSLVRLIPQLVPIPKLETTTDTADSAPDPVT